MSILENLFNQYLYISKNLFGEIFSDVLLERIILHLIEEYDKIINSPLTEDVMPEDINQQIHIVTPCFIIALYHSLKNEISPNFTIDDMLEISMKIFQELVGPLAAMQKRKLKNEDDKWQTFKESTIDDTRSTYSSFNPEFVNNNDKVLEFHLNKCIFYEVFKAHGELPLAPVLCLYDKLFAEAVEEWIVFKRPKTIAHGEKYCQFCYMFKES
ncbi:MAG: L-2-amino-thiazoline-4-carboxylic acid hydrolase [Promethearchaeota archaeon]